MKRMLKISKYAAYILAAIIIVCAAALAVLSICGYVPIPVRTEAMHELYPEGSLLFVTPADPEGIKKGDVITYYYTDGTPLTQRVVELSDEDRYFITKGDSFAVSDAAPVAFESVIGIPAFSIPVIGLAAAALQTFWGGALAVLLLVAVAAVILIPEKKIEKKNEKKIKRQK